MEYELAKELKDAGYKQVGSWWMDKNGKYCEPSMQICECVDPTLSELIEACGDGFRSLANPVDNEWFAESQNPPFKKCETCDSTIQYPELYHGETPEEAVARLWLALNT